MRASKVAAFTACMLMLMVQTATAATLDFQWDKSFDAAERQRLQRWVADTQAGVEQLVGPVNMALRIEMRRSRTAREPVPWAQTLRSQPQGVRFHVDTAYPDAAFYDDWTAAHELSHLVLPYLDSSDAWFAEGFASYMQYPVMAALKRIDAATVVQRYRRNIDGARSEYPYPDVPFAKAAGDLRRGGMYSVMYWGGAAYFLRVDAALLARGSSLPKLLREYVACCRSDYDDLDHLVSVLDRLAGDAVFARERLRVMTEPGFPRAP